MSDSVPSKEPIVHFYAGFPGKALCMGTDTPLLTLSNSNKDRVTCNQCLALLAPKPAELPPSNTLLARCLEVVQEKLDDARNTLESYRGYPTRERRHAAHVEELETLILDIKRAENEPEPARKCMANRSADPPQDCDAPFCGCNPAWDDCIKMLQECDLLIDRRAPRAAQPPPVECFDLKRANELGDAIVQRICDSPDHTSPDDDLQLLTTYPSELHTAVVAELENEFERRTGRSCREQPSPTKGAGQ